MNKIIFSLVIIAFSNGFISQIKFDSLKLAYNETHIDIVEGACFGKKNQFLVTYTYEASHFFLWDVNSNKFLKKINVSHKIEKTKQDSYLVDGTLTIKGVSRNQKVPLKLTKHGNELIFKGDFAINRIDFKVGKKSDAVPDFMNISYTLPVTKK